MTRLAADSTELNDIPVGRFPIILFYRDYLFDAAAVARHAAAGSKMVPITVGINPLDAVIIDVETSDYTPAESVDAVLVQRAKGIDPTVYCNLSTWPAVRAAFIARGVPEPHYLIAAYPGIGAAIYAGAIGHQYLNDAAGTDHYSGGHYDVSIVADFWPGVDGVFGLGGGTIGGDDMLPDERAWLQVVKTAFLGAPPASLASVSDADILTKFSTTDTAAFITQYGQDGYNYASALYHGTPLKALGGGGGTEPAEPAEPKTVTLHVPAQDISGTLS